MSLQNPVIALVAGEASGDQLGAALVQQLRLRYPHARFVGVGGRRMQEAGVPVAIAMAGGYGRQVSDTVDIHFQTVQIAAGMAG